MRAATIKGNCNSRIPCLFAIDIGWKRLGVRAWPEDSSKWNKSILRAMREVVYTYVRIISLTISRVRNVNIFLSPVSFDTVIKHDRDGIKLPSFHRWQAIRHCNRFTMGHYSSGFGTIVISPHRISVYVIIRTCTCVGADVGREKRRGTLSDYFIIYTP